MIEIMYTINVMPLNHLETIPPPHSQSMEKLFSMKLVRDIKKIGAHSLRLFHVLLRQFLTPNLLFSTYFSHSNFTHT